MKMIIEFFTMFLFLVVFLLVSVTYVNQNVSLNSAREYHESIVTELQDHDFASSSIEDIKHNAELTNYDVHIEDTTISEAKKKYKVTVTFNYKVPLVGLDQNYSVVGYAS